MSALVIKTGMTVEQQIARKYAAEGILVLTGAFTPETLDQAVPQDCKAILSLGVCGGLADSALIGQAFICSTLVTPDGEFEADVDWRRRLFGATRYYECHWWSSGNFNTANTVAERAALVKQTGCAVIDDETFAVAAVAKKRGIAFQALRTVSDGAEDNLPPAVVNALNPDGSDNLYSVIASVAQDPTQIPALIQTAIEAKKSFDELETACIQVGPNFQWQSNS
ncbi:MAG TPA: hypothetical protein VH206_12830 [Xanthobacteraceae bacterium]|jgi:hypothetical protein|nr:hypothetical protein [Xanthobacteraceae bacterium]